MAQITLNSSGVASNGSLLLQSNGTTTAVTVDASQNVGLGVTPSAWGSGFKALQIGARSAFFDSSTTTLLGNNTYYDGSNYKYIATAAASLYDTTAGLHRWYNAASGTAGNTISFTQAMTLDANGRLFVNTTTEPGSNDSVVVIKAGGTSKSRSLSLEAVTTGSVIVQTFRNPNGEVGYIATNGSATQYSTSSDYRLKESIQLMTGGLAKVAALKPCTYKWKSDGSDGQGFIAHELQEVYPDAVIGEKDGTRIEQYEVSPAVPATLDEDGNELTSAVEAVMGEREVPSYQGIDTSFLVATLTAAIQELKALVDTQASTITQLQADVASLKAQP